MEHPVSFDSLRQAFRDQSIDSATNADLQTAVGILANSTILNDAVRHEAIVMASAVQSILLRRLLDEQERRNRKTQFWFMVLALSSILVGVAQIWLSP